MISPDALILALVLGYGALCSFVCYWHGFNKGRDEGRDEAERIYDDLDEATRLLHEMATKQRHPAGRLAVVREDTP